jgi:hypothetical protein
MKLTNKVVRKVEVPKITGKLRSFILKYPSPMIAIILFLSLIYLIYSVIIIRDFGFMPLDPTQSYKNILYASALLASFLVIFSRNKHKNRAHMFFFLNSHVKAYEIIIAGYAPIYIAFIATNTFAFAPFIAVYWRQDKINSFVDIFVLLFVLTFVFSLTCLVWQLSNLLVKNLLGRTKEHLTVASILHCFMLAFFIYILIQSLQKHLEYNMPMFSIILSSLLLSVVLIFNRTSTTYLRNLYLHYNNDTSIRSINSTNFKLSNKFFMNLKIELLNLYRKHILKEQLLIYIFLILVSLIFYFTLPAASFSVINSYIISFGLKEIFIILSLTIGVSYRRYIGANYLLNYSKYIYILPRIFLVMALMESNTLISNSDW